MPNDKVTQKKKGDQPNNKTMQLVAKWMIQKSAGDQEAKNTEYQILAEENKVTDLPSFINEIEYRWKGNPWLGGYNPTLEKIFNTPKPAVGSSPYEKLIKLFNPAKKQQGGQLNMNEQELQQAFIQYLAQKTGAKSQQELEAVIQQLGEEGLKQAYQEFMQIMQQQQVQAAKFGAKLNYIKQLRGKCPDGYEMQYFKSGGQLCKKCIKKQVMQEGGDIPQNPIDAFKCGRKMKKKEQGGNIEFDKCGKKIKKKKCEVGGTVDMDKCGAKIKKKKCENGGFISFDKCGKKMKKKEIGGIMNNPVTNKDKKIKAPIKSPKKLDPKNTRNLPGGKYPSNWTPKDRMTWERTWGQGDEGAASTTNKGVTKNACGSKLIRKKKS